MTQVPQAEQAIIFINYRRTDAGWPADYLASKLQGSFGEDRVFLDVRGIAAGDDFAAVLEDQLLRRASILIVLIGNNWLHVHDEFGRRRLDQDDDWVRREIRIALHREDCKVIPVLIDDAELPDKREALPEDISALVTRQRIRVRQANSDDDIEALSRELEKAGFRRRAEGTSLQAVRNIVSGCYRRAVFTRTHAQLSHEAMLASISACRALVQSEAPKVSPPDLSQSVGNVLGALDQIERLGKKGPENLASEDFRQIDHWKLEALRGLRFLSRKTGSPYPIPEILTEEVFFSQEEADGPPTVRMR